MKYTYAYKTSDGRRHEAAMDAESREAVFEALRKDGIRPIKVVAADGSKANGEEGRSKKEGAKSNGRKPWRGALLVLLVPLVLVALVFYQRIPERRADPSATATPRHQIYGDPAIMEAFERGEFGEALPREGDRLLAVFAQPGRLMCRKGLDPHRPDAALLDEFSKYVSAELDPERDIAVDAAGALREVCELRQIVNGMRRELREYLANGNGTPRSYWRRLVERTREEAQIYERTRRELEGESDPDAYELKNAALRRLGLRTIPSPGDGE